MTRPPRVSRWLLRSVLSFTHSEALVGDLDEEFFEHVVPDRGVWRARMWYRSQLVRSLPSALRHRIARGRERHRHRRKTENLMHRLLQDIRFSLRGLRRDLGFTLVIMATLALGIGATTILYGVVDGLVLNPFPFPDGDRLVTVGTEYPKLGTDLNFVEHMSPAEYVDIRDGSRSLEAIVAWDMGNRQVSWGELTENLFTGFWWGDAFETIGTTAFLGRGLTLEESVRGDRVAVLSHRVWQSRFGADPDIIGKTIGMNGNPYTVIGIMPPRSELYGMDMWIPMGVGPEVFPRQRRQWQVLARVREGYDLERVNAELEVLARRAEMEHAELEEYEGWRMRAATWTEANVRQVKPAGYVLLGAVAFVLLIMCSNVASLLLARSTTRRREMAVRTAMGAARGRLVRQMLTESVGISVVSGVIGIGIAYLGTQAIANILATVPFLPGAVELNPRVLSFAVAASIGVGVLFGIIPAMQNSGSDIQSTLKSEGTAATGSVRRLRLQRVLVSAEVALALVLLVGGGLLVHSLARLTRVDTGFQPDDVLSMRLTLPWEQHDAASIGAFFQTLEERVEALPGVEAVGRGAQFPPISFAFRRVATEGLALTDEGRLPMAMSTLASPGYFEALGIPLVRGRSFNDFDVEGSPLVAVINEAAAQLLFADGDPVGSRFRAGTEADDPWFEVVGVVGNTRNNGLDEPPLPEVFANHRQVPGWSNQMFLLVRTRVEPYSIVPAVRSVVRALDPDQPVYRIRTVGEVLAVSTAPRRIAARVLTAFAAFALVLAAVGIFAVVSFAVGARSREIGLRVALGAGGRQVQMLMVRQALVPVVVGGLIGLGGALALSRFMSGLLFEVRGTDPLTLASVTVLFCAVAIAASYLPARRASRLDPVEALRVE